MVMLKVLRSLLEQLINDIDSGNSNIPEEQELETIQFIQKITSKQLSKLESANYIGVSRATFDNYINRGLILKELNDQDLKNYHGINMIQINL